ncbi:MAG: hypothetical protein ABL984_12160 [Pyrinomonadaceae bacterium]
MSYIHWFFVARALLRIIARMGLDSNGIKLLLYARKLGVDFASTATIGRQFNHADPAEIRRIFLSAGEAMLDPATLQTMLDDHNGFSEGIFRLLGAKATESFDASDFEGSTHVHDFNLPISDRFKASYTTVFDGGTLEHVFNYPTALKNCMEMIVEGGHFLGISPVNNFPGHGFYQFSPELFFRIFSVEQGFEILDMIFVEDYSDAPWYRVADPKSLGHRVTFENTRPAYLLLIACRRSIEPIFQSFPQQSDYAATWNSGQPLGGFETGGNRAVSRITKAAIRRLRRFVDPGAIRFTPSDLTRFDPF